MKYVLAVLAMAVVLVGCAKKNPPKPERLFKASAELAGSNRIHVDLSNRLYKQFGDNKKNWPVSSYAEWKAEEDRLEALFQKEMARWNNIEAEWWNSLVICLHCGSDLKKKGAAVCADCGRNQR